MQREGAMLQAAMAMFACLLESGGACDSNERAFTA